MTVARNDDLVVLSGVCTVEDAEALLQAVLSGVQAVDWSECSHLHAACLQILMAAQLPLRGSPDSTDLARWIQPILHEASTFEEQSKADGA